MKAETAEQRLAALLGLSDKFQPKDPKKKTTNSPTNIAIEEADLQKQRRIEGVYYFLQAPDLFSTRVCKNCHEPFLVSRRNVAHCSYTCLKSSLLKLGIEWTRDGDYIELAKDVWDNNEPLIITKVDQIQTILNKIKTATVLDTVTDDPESLQAVLDKQA